MNKHAKNVLYTNKKTGGYIKEKKMRKKSDYSKILLIYTRSNFVAELVDVQNGRGGMDGVGRLKR